jgi:hypothetical protein
MLEALVPPKRRFLQDPQGITSQKTSFFIATAVKDTFYIVRKVDNEALGHKRCAGILKRK